ncbi:MAG: InlB B-repeat-containing protein, partial [Alphaproteobacteria bacterium]|nr:InlB B-repeat-containing protein [Alphaproteobacteria bacterium]
MTTLFVVSVSCGLFTKNAFADDKIITGGPGTCTVDVLGVSDESAFAKVIAVYQLQQYTCVPGTYLNKTETEVFCDDCPLNSYCPGGTFSVEDTYLGQNLCPDNYITLSKNSVSQSDCVMDCDWNCSGNNCVPCLPEVTDGFIVRTSLMNDGDEFKFDISAAGTFTIDWGDGNVETITKTNIANQTLTHKYEITGQFEIKISGSSTAYSTELPAISFQCKNNAGNYIVDHPLVGIGGSLGSVFSTIDGTKQPLFTKTFYGCETLSSQIPSDLFYGITGQPADYMFKQTFYGCSLLTSVPVNLFSGVSGTATGLFEGTFANTNLTGDITGLFAGIKGIPADYMFSETFLNTNLKVIPDSLFDGVKGETEGNVGKYMFENTFAGTGITAIPENLFSDMTPAEGMFYGTFSYTPITAIPQYLFLHVSGSPKPYLFAYAFKNTKITSIPPVLFDAISGSPAVSMFAGTFENCTELSGQIPAGLFKNIKGTPANTMFMKTFSGDEKLSSYIPPELFKGINAQEFRTGQMEDVFLGSGILEQCPADMVQYITGFEADFDSKVSCTFCPENSTVQGEAGSTYCECNDGYTVFGEINGATRVQYNQTCELPSITFEYSCGSNATSDSVPPSGGRVIIGSDTLIALGNTCKRENYDFANWKIDGTDLVFNPNESFPWDWIVQEGKTKIYFTAQYTPKDYNILYSCDGTGINKVQNVTYGEEYILSDAICSKNGAVQVGWRQSDTQELFPFGHMDTYLFGSNKTFIAEFTSIYTITYSCGDGTGNAPESQGPILQDEEYVPQNNTCTAPAGYSFDGWSVSNTENIVQQPGQMYNYTFWEDKTFTAIWKPNCNKITLDATTNGGSGGTRVIYKKTGSGTAYSDDQCNVEISSVKIPTKSRATFTGYYTVAELSGGNQCITPGGAILSTDTCNVMAPTTWYARYDCNSDYTGSGVNISGRCTDDLSTVIYDCG